MVFIQQINFEDKKFLSIEDKEFLNLTSKVANKQKCIQLYTNDAALLYLLKLFNCWPFKTLIIFLSFIVNFFFKIFFITTVSFNNYFIFYFYFFSIVRTNMSSS